MNDKLNVCIVGPFGAGVVALRQLGHAVLSVAQSEELFCNLPEILKKNDFRPDLVLQVECLGKRTLIQGLDTLDCPTLFWATDPHLNLHWHNTYGRLFDQVLSTQQSLVAPFKLEGLSDVRWLPRFAFDLPSPSIAARKHEIAFVGRLSDQRPGRKWMVDFVKSRVGERSFPVEQSLSHSEMLALYQDTKIIPNESILGEVNFRLFEGTSCGSLLLTQDLGAEQASLFEPGREIDTYADAAEFEEKLKFYLGNDDLIQKMGQAAHKRVQSEHMPIHRTEQILDFAKDTARNRATPSEAEKWLAVAIASMWESGMLDLPVREVLSRLAASSQDEHVVVATLRVQTVINANLVVEENLINLLGGELFEDSFGVNFTGSAAALRLGNWDAAKAFWYRHLKAVNNTKLPPKEPKDLLICWAKELKKHQRVFRGGFPFKSKTHLPHTALDCLLILCDNDPQDAEVLRLIDVMLRPRKELDQVRGGFLASLVAQDSNDWRLLFEQALTNLHSYRLDDGMQKLMLARELARERGQERAFSMALRGRDESGVILKRMFDYQKDSKSVC
ncbi:MULTISPECIES: glycosyltransferase family protein [unclassified Maridesulfovibrio]|uniref:glycosyltransferase family protein n=1 Tax=unclassified Maridesulfovibrio TaxID=2794999 RepID=UPI003B3F7CFE